MEGGESKIIHLSEEQRSLHMAQPARKTAKYEDLYDIPDHMTGEIINGELIVTPKPAPNHALAAFALGSKIGPRYHFGEGGGPGGWVILPEVEIMFGEDLLAPDWSGWKKERFPGWPEDNWFSIAPDWICEILSPSTAGNDKIRKMDIYARFEVSYCWLVDPRDRTLETFMLRSGIWARIGGFVDNAMVKAEPFIEVEFDLGSFWAKKNAESASNPDGRDG
jgi:Uma2 family endonuclease